MLQKFRFERKFVTTNENNDLNRSHWSKGAAIKKTETQYAWALCKQQRLVPFTKLVRIKCFWKYKRTNEDPDNLRSQIKPILDGMVQAGVLQGDSLKYIQGFDGDDYMKSEHEGGEIHIYEIE